VQAAAWVREHGETVEFFFTGIFHTFKTVVRFPVLLCLGFYLLGLVLFVHHYNRLKSLTNKRQH